MPTFGTVQIVYRKTFVEAGCSSYEPKWIFVDHEYEEFDALSVARALDGASK